MDDILKKITQQTLKDLSVRKKNVTLSDLRSMPGYSRKTYSLYESLKNGTGIIAEHKRQSPSKGSFECPAELEEVVKGYENAGVSAISCLTDEPFFGGSLVDLEAARDYVKIPLLRKDFMVDLYQVHEAKAYGADAILLIAACLDDEQMKTLATEALNLNLEILFEVHNKEELDRVIQLTQSFNTTKFVIGVNNRDLKKFETSIEISKSLIAHFPKDVLAVSESGISNPEVLKQLKQIGFQGFLIGEYFMKTDDPGRALGSFIKSVEA